MTHADLYADSCGLEHAAAPVAWWVPARILHAGSAGPSRYWFAAKEVGGNDATLCLLALGRPLELSSWSEGTW